MNLHRPRIDVRLESIERIGQGRYFECHGCFSLFSGQRRDGPAWQAGCQSDSNKSKTQVRAPKSTRPKAKQHILFRGGGQMMGELTTGAAMMMVMKSNLTVFGWFMLAWLSISLSTPAE
jgi:hypothetical protein